MGSHLAIAAAPPARRRRLPMPAVTGTRRGQGAVLKVQGVGLAAGTSRY